MGVLDDAIRDHLALKRKHGADEAELARAEAEALGPARREPVADPYAEDPAAYGETGGSIPYDVQADETATTPFDHQDGPTYEPPAPEPPTRIAPAPDAPPPDEPPVEEPQPAAYEPPAEPPPEHPPPAEAYEPPAPSPEHPPAAEAYEPPPEHPPAAEAYEPPPVEHPPPSEAYEPPAPVEPSLEHEAYEPPPVEHPTPPESYEPPAETQPEPAGADPHDYEDFSYKGEPEPPGYAAPAEEPAVPGHDEPVGQGDPLVPYSWHHDDDPDAPHEDPGAPHEEPEALHGAEVVHEEPEVVHEPEVVQDAEVVHEEPAPPPVGEHDDTAVKPPDEAYREAAAHQPTEYFTPPDVEPTQESRGRRLRRLFSRKSDR